MNRNLYKTLFAVIMALLFSAFSIEPDDRDRTAYHPVLMKKADLLTSISNQPYRGFDNPGKIYLYEQYIYIVDLFKGIHVIDNADPSHPQKAGFINIPGVMDLAIRNNVLFADNAIDLVSIDIANYPQIEVLDRMSGVFPEPTPPDLEWIPWAYSAHRRPEGTVIVGWYK